MVLSVSVLDHMFGLATIVHDAIDVASVHVDGFTRYALLDRGSYEVAPGPSLPELARVASDVTGRSLAVVESRVLRLRAGDYLLAHHDSIYADNPVEVVADLSPSRVIGAEVHYRRRGQVFLRFPSQPGAVSVVERGPTVTCNHTYVSKLRPDALVIRLVALLR